MIDIPTDTIVCPLLIESRSVPAYCCLIDEAELDDGLSWYHGIYHFLRFDTYPKISLKSSSGHDFILVAIDYFTKWVEVASYARLTSSRTNGAVKAPNKNIKRILQRMIETSRDWSKKLPFSLWAYRTSFRTSIGTTPYSLVYGMETMLPIEIEMGSLRVALE
ncbi:hypothetical protein AAG906_029237 [Vitis piasezkii]